MSDAHDTIAGVFWLMVAVVAIVVFGTAAVAAGVGGTMARPAVDPKSLGDVDAPVQPSDLEAVRFPVVLRGYRMEAVDEVLARAGDELEARDRRITELEIAIGIRREPEPEYEPAVAGPEDVPEPEPVTETQEI